MRNINCINYILTTNCNRNCPECCCDVPNKTGIDVSWIYIVESAKYLKGINRINLSGGEPTLHPYFEEIVPKLRELFQCNLLTIETNGYGFEKFPEIFKYFDWIQATHYSSESYEGSDDNEEQVKFIQDYLKDSKTVVLVANVTHVLRSRRSSGEICERGKSETAAYENGLIYPCCVAPGIEGGKGIPLSSNWKEEILKTEMPCNNCHFAGP
jgi:organic radical activating enzyme